MLASSTPVAYSISASDKGVFRSVEIRPIGTSALRLENRLKKLIRIWRALHEYVNFVHDPDKQHMSLIIYRLPASFMAGVGQVIVADGGCAVAVACGTAAAEGGKA